MLSWMAALKMSKSLSMRIGHFLSTTLAILSGPGVFKPFSLGIASTRCLWDIGVQFSAGSG